MRKLLNNVIDKLNSIKREYRNNKAMLIIGTVVLALVSIDFSSALDRSSSAPDGLTFICLMSLFLFSSLVIMSLLVAAYIANNYRSHSITKWFSIALLSISAPFILLTILIHGEGSMIKWLIDLVATVVGFIIDTIT